MFQPIFNKKAGFDYFLRDHFEAGILLTGGEVKSIRSGSVSLGDSYVKVINNEVFLLNAYIAPYKMAIDPSYDPKRDRKLLLNKDEIEEISGKLASKNLTVVPVKLYNKSNLIKVDIALASPKKKADKRDSLKKKALDRETQSYLRESKLKSQK